MSVSVTVLGDDFPEVSVRRELPLHGVRGTFLQGVGGSSEGYGEGKGKGEC